MRVDGYKAIKSPGPGKTLWVLVRKGEKVPDDAKKQIGKSTFYKSIDIKPGEKRIAIDTDKAIQDIQKQGYHITQTEIIFQMNVGGRKP